MLRILHTVQSRCARHTAVRLLPTASFATAPSKRWRLVDNLFNHYREAHAQEVGPDRACAEFVCMQEGSCVTATGTSIFTLANIPSLPFHLSSISLDNSGVNANGLRYVQPCTHVNSLSLHNCYLIGDSAIHQLASSLPALRSLNLSDCHSVTVDGLTHLQHHSSLDRLDISNTATSEEDLCKLKKILPNVSIKHHCASSVK